MPRPGFNAKMVFDGPPMGDHDGLWVGCGLGPTKPQPLRFGFWGEVFNPFAVPGAV